MTDEQRRLRYYLEQRALRLPEREFRRLYEGEFMPASNEQSRVDIYDFMQQLQQRTNEALEAGFRRVDLRAIMHPRDRDRVEQAAERLNDYRLLPPLPSPSINMVGGIPIIVRDDIEEGLVYVVASERPLHVYRFEIRNEPEPAPRTKPDNSPMIGGQNPDITGNEPMLGSKPESEGK